MNWRNFFNPADTPHKDDPKADAIIPEGFAARRAGLRWRSPFTRTSGLSGLTLLAAMLAISGNTQAGSLLPGATGYLQAFSAPGVFVAEDPTQFSLARSKSVGFTLGGFYSSIANAQGGFTPSPYLIVDISGTGVVGSGYPFAGGLIEYNLRVNGPPTMDTVPVQVSFSLGFSSSNREDIYQVGGYVGVNSDASGVLAFSSNLCDNSTSASTICSSDEVSGTTAQETTEDLMLQPNTVETVSITAFIGYQSASPTYDGGVLIDPVFTINPDFLAQNPGYSLEFSDGVGNSPDAPEPATWAMMLVGFGGLCAAVRGKGHSR